MAVFVCLTWQIHYFIISLKSLTSEFLFYSLYDCGETKPHFMIYWQINTQKSCNRNWIICKSKLYTLRIRIKNLIRCASNVMCLMSFMINWKTNKPLTKCRILSFSLISISTYLMWKLKWKLKCLWRFRVHESSQFVTFPLSSVHRLPWYLC